jgi:hypothetical protein
MICSVLSVFSSGVKRPVHEAEHSPPSSAEFKNGGAILPLPHTSSWRCPQLIKYGDNFTFNMNTSLNVRISFIKQEFILLPFNIKSKK